MSTIRDYQKQRVYNWEFEHIRPRDGTYVTVECAQPLVNHIWQEMSLEFPPQVLPIAAQTTRWSGTALRSRINLQPRVQTCVLLHELAHSLTMNYDDETDGPAHGPRFVGMFYKLLEKYLGVPGPLMMHTLNASKVDFDLGVTPYFLKK